MLPAEGNSFDHDPRTPHGHAFQRTTGDYDINVWDTAWPLDLSEDKYYYCAGQQTR